MEEETKVNVTPNRKNVQIPNLETQSEQILCNITQLTEIALELKEKCNANEKHLSNLRIYAIRALKKVNQIQNSTKSFLTLAQKSTSSVLKLFETLSPANPKCLNLLKCEYEKLQVIIEKELSTMDDNNDNQSMDTSLKSISKRIKCLEERQNLNDSILQSGNSTKSYLSDVDEKYPEMSCRRDSFMDLDNVVHLAPVPEGAFLSLRAKLKRPPSLLSLRKLSKVKLCLQQVVSDKQHQSADDPNSSNCESVNQSQSDTDGRDSFLNKTNYSQLDDIEEEEEEEEENDKTNQTI